MVNDTDKFTQLRRDKENKKNEISGLERKISTETNPDKKSALEIELATAKRELTVIEGDIVREIQRNPYRY